jgi:hypothetical protein
MFKSLESPLLVPSLKSSLFAVAALAAVAGAGCGALEAPAPDGVGQAMLAIAVVPAEVRCVRITAAGSGRTLVRELDVVGGTALTQSLSGLPLGSVTVLGEAFPGACDAVTKSTIPTWVSDPVDVSVVLGRSSTIELTMVRNGRAKIDVSFSDEPACSAAGAACLSAAECCSHACTAHVCAGSDAGADPGDGSAP